jgi:hypothetical protein
VNADQSSDSGDSACSSGSSDHLSRLDDEAPEFVEDDSKGNGEKSTAYSVSPVK